MKRNCINCHFLSKSSREHNSNREITYSLNKNERTTLQKDPVGFDRGYSSLQCHMGVWDEGISPVAIKEDQQLLTQNRKRTCFYIPYRKSMLFKAAIEIQKREEENSQLKKTNSYAVSGLMLAAIGLIINAVINYLKYVSSN